MDHTTNQTLYYNGTIYNTNEKEPHYDYMIVNNDGKIIKCGRGLDHLKDEFQGTMYDLHGRFVLPGLHDSHIHTYLLGLFFTQIFF